MASPYLETIRSPLAQSRCHVAAADANLTGIVTILASGAPVTRETIRKALARCEHARQAMDQAIFAALGVQALDGRNLSTGDADDMWTALHVALERIEDRPEPIRTGFPEVVSAHA